MWAIYSIDLGTKGLSETRVLSQIRVFTDVINSYRLIPSHILWWIARSANTAAQFSDFSIWRGTPRFGIT